MSQRSSGQGSVFQSSNGRWVAMIELPRKPNGKRNRPKKRARTRAEAQRLLKEMQSELDEHGQLPARDRTIQQTVDTYIQQVREANPKLAKATIIKDKGIAKQITGYFSKTKTAGLTVQSCDAFLAKFATGELTGKDGPVSRDYVRETRSLLAAALKNDMRLGYINRNVAEISVLPNTTSTKRPRRSLTREQWRSLYDSATGNIKLVLDFGGRHGLRPQEIRAINWSDIDFDASTISVINQLDSYDESTDTKTVRSTRTIKLHPETIALLKEWRVQQDQMKDRAGDAWVTTDLVITTRRGTPINRNNQIRSVNTVCAKTDIGRITPYELRHTAITHQVEAGHSVSQIADWAGTSEKMIYKHYRHKIRELIDLAPVDL